MVFHNDTHSLESGFIDSNIDPASVPLRPEEKIISAQIVSIRKPAQPINALSALQLLCNAKQPGDIGKKGPAVAALAFPESANTQELRLYEVVFGRDSLITARFVLNYFPELMRSTILRLAELQGVQCNEKSEEEVGRIIHEARSAKDPLAQAITKARGWEWPYYGTIDATPLFISAVANFALQHDPTILKETFVDRTGASKTVVNALEVALGWLKNKIGENPEGFVESRRHNTIGGNLIQSWKDSADSHHHANGNLANINQGISSIEVQGLTYDALLDTIDLYQGVLTDKMAMIPELKALAEQISRNVFRYLWVNDKNGAFFALGSDRDNNGNLRPLAIRTSNMGHLLNTRLLDGTSSELKHIKDQLVENLFSPQLLAKHGIRTLADNENRYRPLSYHNGSVWPWDNFFISLGLLRQGYSIQARDIWQRILGIINHTQRFPELVSGENTTEPILSKRFISVLDTKYNITHAIEQPPQEIQAWTVAAVVAIEYLNKKID